MQDADGLTQTVIAQLGSQVTDGALTRAVIVNTTTATLRRFDAVAATMYAAYHH